MLQGAVLTNLGAATEAGAFIHGKRAGGDVAGDVGLSIEMATIALNVAFHLAVDVHLTGVDIAPEMIRIAQEKFPLEQVDFLCGDVEELPLEPVYDCIVVYNAFPHFPEPERLVRRLAGLLKPGGRLTIAHGQSRAAIDNHHKGRASKVSCGLVSEHVLAAMMRKYLRLEVKISDDRMYQVSGIRK